MAINIENEPFVRVVEFASQNEGNVASDWLCGRAQTIKSQLGSGSAIAVATGGVAGSVQATESNPYLDWADQVLQCSAIDIVSVHGYVGDDSSWDDVLKRALVAVRGAGKPIMVDEWSVGYQHDKFYSQAFKINSYDVPWLQWEIIPGQETYRQDEYEMSTCGGQRDNIKSKINEAISRPIAKGLKGLSRYMNKDESTPTTLIQSGPTTPTSNNPQTCGTTTCDWPGHCFGTTYGSGNDCTNNLTCNAGRCGCVQQSMMARIPPWQIVSVISVQEQYYVCKYQFFL